MGGYVLSVELFSLSLYSEGGGSWFPWNVGIHTVRLHGGISQKIRIQNFTSANLCESLIGCEKPFNGGVFVGYLTMLSFSRYVTWGGRMIDEWWRIGKDLEGSVCGLIKVLLGICLQGLRKPLEFSLRIANIPTEIWTEHFPNTGLERQLQSSSMKDFCRKLILLFHNEPTG
jgi:hypothetical protein